MTGGRTLKNELRKCITDYVHHWEHQQIGDATTAELAVMACVSSNEPLSIPDAMSWMRCHSRKSLDVPNTASPSDSDQIRLPRPRCNSDASIVAQDGFDDEPVLKVVDCSEKPSHPPKEIDDSLTDFTVPIHEFDQLDTKHWTSPISSANVFLRRRLFPYRIEPSQSHFRIMDLPVEAREMIFEFALLLPRSGVWYDFQTRDKDNGFGECYLTLQAWTRDRDFVPSQYLPNTWNIDRDSLGGGPKALFRVDLESHLALFRVSKQVHKEAFACYYSQNIFYLPNDYAFLKLFKYLSDDQFRHLGHVVWRWTKIEPPSEKYVQQFAALPRLRTLVIDAKEEEYDEFGYMFNWNRNAGLSVDNVSHLTAIKGLQNVVFFGPIARHEQFLRSQMVGWKS